MDQSPFPFARDTSTRYEQIEKRKKENRNQKVCAAQPKQGDSKRFCTLNICFRSSGEQLIAVSSQADTEFVVNWAEKTMKPVVPDVSYFILFLDNLEAHVHESFRI